MQKQSRLTCTLTLLALSLAACSNSDDKSNATSEFNPGLNDFQSSDGVPGGDTTAIAGLWDGTGLNSDTDDVVYWNLANDGLLTRYDYQQDGGATTSGQNCFIVGDPTTVTPEGNNSYSIRNVAVEATRNGDSLTIMFIDSDVNDLNANGDTDEMPTFNWVLLASPTLEDLNPCT